MKKQVIVSTGLASAMVISTLAGPVAVLADVKPEESRVEQKMKSKAGKGTDVSSEQSKKALQEFRKGMPNGPKLGTNKQVPTKRTEPVTKQRQAAKIARIGEGKAFEQLIPDAELRGGIATYGGYKEGENLISDDVTILNESDDATAVKQVLAKITWLCLYQQDTYSVTNLTGINNLTNLEHLDFDNDTNVGVKHNIKSIASGTFANMSKLDIIYLDGNGLESIDPDAFENNDKLRYLIIYDNPLTDFDFLHPLSLNMNVQAGWNKSVIWQDSVKLLAETNGVPIPVFLDNSGMDMQRVVKLTAKFKQQLQGNHAYDDELNNIDYSYLNQNETFKRLIPDGGLRTAIVEAVDGEAQKILNESDSEATIKEVLKSINNLQNYGGEVTIRSLDGINNLTNLEYLYLEDQCIVELKANTFADMDKLSRLYLSDSGTTSIDENAFAGLTSLKYLDFYNGFEQVKLKAKTFAPLNNLEELYLYNCDISTTNFANLTKLIEFGLGGKLGLTKLDAKIFAKMTALEYFDLYYSLITEIDENTFVGLDKLKSVYLENNSNLTNFDFLHALSVSSNLGTSTEDWERSLAWQDSVNELAVSLGVMPLEFIGSTSSTAIACAKFKQGLNVIKNTQNVGGVTNNDAIKAAQDELKAAVESGDEAQISTLKNNLYNLINTEIKSTSDSLIKNANNNAAVKTALAAVETAKNNHDYGNMATLINNLKTVVATYKTATVNNANKLLTHQSVKTAGANTNIARAKTNLQNALNATGKNYDQIAELTQKLTAAINGTTIKQVKVSVAKSYHKNNYITVTTTKGNKVTVKAGNKVVATMTAKSDNKFNIKINGLKAKQKLTVIAERNDEATILHTTTTVTHQVTASPKVKAKKLKVKGKLVTGTVKKGSTVKVYKGKKLIAEKVIKNGKIKITLKKKYAKKTKLKITIQHDHANGFASKTWTVRVK
ncbi:leucine-rich repeat domain-containing protein [Periweissella cryptocerci]|nr:leucine-rich repeat domain-containing protein [Periweissella cryptocerci]